MTAFVFMVYFPHDITVSDKPLGCAVDIWLQNMLKVAKSQKKLMFTPLGLYWWSWLQEEKQWTLTGPRASSVLLNGYDLLDSNYTSEDPFMFGIENIL